MIWRAGTALFRRLQRRRWPGLNRRVVLFLCHSLLFHIALLGIADVLLNFYLVSVGYDAATIGLLQALPRLGGFLIGLPVGLFANRVGNRTLIMLSSAGLSLCVAATALVQAPAPIALSRFLWGAFFGAGQVVKPPFMVTLTPPSEHTAQFAYHNLVSMFAVAFGSVLGGVMPVFVSQLLAMQDFGGLRAAEMPLAYQAAIVLAALVLFLSALPLLFLRDDARAAPKRLVLPKLAAWRKILRLTFPLFVFGISGGLTFPFFNLFFRDLFGISDGAVGGIIGFGWLMMGIAPMLNPHWEARLGRVRALVVLMVASAVAFVLLGLAQTLLAAVGFYVLAIGLRNTMQPLFQPLLMDALAVELRNFASSVGLVLWNLGWFTATVSFGHLQAAFGYRHIMLLAAFFVVMNAVSVRWSAGQRGAGE